MKVGVCFCIADLFDRAFNSNHPLKFYPVKLQRRKGVAGELFAFAAFKIGVPNDALFIEPFDEYHPGRGPHIAAHGGQGHGIGLRDFCSNGFVHPLAKLI